jgi:hypothetical protein
MRIVAKRQHADANGGVEGLIVKRQPVCIRHVKAENLMIGTHGQSFRQSDSVRLGVDTHDTTTKSGPGCARRYDQRGHHTAVNSTAAPQIEDPLAGSEPEQVKMSLKLCPGRRRLSLLFQREQEILVELDDGPGHDPPLSTAGTVAAIGTAISQPLDGR